VRPAEEVGHRVGVEFLAPSAEVARCIDEYCHVLLPARRAALSHRAVPRPEEIRSRVGPVTEGAPGEAEVSPQAG
jgi:hypothetical protein